MKGEVNWFMDLYTQITDSDVFLVNNNDIFF